MPETLIVEAEETIEKENRLPRISADQVDSYNALLGILGYKRPHNSRTERRCIARFLKPLGLEQDKFGNYWKRIGDAPIMWSSHTDTVHGRKGIQKLGFAEKGSEVGIHEKETSDCLGADDGAGMWLMREMILAKRPGLYIFHRDEEHGRN